MKKIAILTLPFEPNYGWMLQIWALYSFLQKNGYEVTVLDRRWNDENPSLFKTIQRIIYYKIFVHEFFSFYHEKMKVSPEIRSSASLREYVDKEHFEAIVVGSDQVWRIENTRGADLNYFLDFAEGLPIKKIAYAASFGKDEWKGNSLETKRINALLKDFDLITTRESSGVELCKKLFDENAEHVIDPTMLILESDYSSLFENGNTPVNSFIATYILDFSQTKYQLITSIQHTFNIKKIVDLYPQKVSRFNNYKSIQSWLKSIHDANYVIIDSFHGMVFSILFHKQFVVIGNRKRGMTRFISLLDSLGLSERLISDDFKEEDVLKMLSVPINYDDVESKLQNLRQHSSNLLLKKLEH